jgi:peptidyl-prolyl cis-trans isomerase D
VVQAAFASDVGVDNDPIDTDGGYVWYDVAGITPAHDRTLDEVKSEVEQHWRDDQTADRLKAKATELVDKLKNGTPLDALAAANGLTVQKSGDLKRGAGNGVIPARVIETVFHTAKDAYGSAAGDDPTQWTVFRITEVKTPALDPTSADAKSVAQMVEQQLSNDIMNEYVGWLENNLGTTINSAVLAQALGNSAPETN